MSTWTVLRCSREKHTYSSRLTQCGGGAIPRKKPAFTRRLGGFNIDSDGSDYSPSIGGQRFVWAVKYGRNSLFPLLHSLRC